MHDNLYWLISITSDCARVSLVNQDVITQGQEIAWDPNIAESLLKAIDTSLSSQNGDEVSNCAFIVPPTWVQDDGKIFPQMLSSLKTICQGLKLKPLGFVSFDDAFIESYNSSDTFPSSYILVNFGLSHYQISLVYLGQIKKRHLQLFDTNFSVSEFEKVLSSFDFSSALPPKIVVTGTYTNEAIEDLSSYNWVGNQNIETFLHLPDVVAIDSLSLDKIYVDTIKKQISPATSISVISETKTPADDAEIEQVDSDMLGFTQDDSPQPANILESQPVVFRHPPKKPFVFPKISFNYYWLLPFTLLPFIPIVPLFMSKVDITIHQNQTEFSETQDVTLDPKTNVSQKSFDLSVGTSIATTGKKEVGEKAKGEVIIYNKSDRAVSLNKGLVITDASGKKFETTSNILLPASTYNLDTGVINMGQIKATVAAQAIGPESNLPVNTTLTIKDDSNLLAKTSSEFSGGTRLQVSVVTQLDRTTLQENALKLLKNQASENINSQKSSQNSILESTMLFENQKSKFSREVGEVADTLTLNLSAKVSFMYFDFAQKQDMVSKLFSQKSSLAALDKNSAVVSLNYANNKLTISGKANPKVDINKVKLNLIKKRESELKTILNSVPGYYQHQISNSLWFINLLARLPVNPNSINIIIKN